MNEVIVNEEYLRLLTRQRREALFREAEDRRRHREIARCARPVRARLAGLFDRLGAACFDVCDLLADRSTTF